MFRDKAAEITAKGEARRGHFSPDADSAHLKVYKWWVENSNYGETPQRENFCHYWRVVLIWSPLIWVAFKVIGGIEWITSKFPKRPKERNSFFSKHKRGINKVLMGLLYVVLGLVILVTLVSLIMAFLSAPLKGLFILGIIALATTVATGTTLIVGKFVEKRREAYLQRREDWFDGKISDEEYFGTKAKKAPGKISKFFKAVGDFCHLAFQAVRVKKWKICPFVEIPD